jgi:sigma-E factor negative regulatory protein RseB
MRQVTVALSPTVLLLSLWAGWAAAGTLEQNEALGWLQKIANAARQLNYSGTFVYQHGDQVETSRISHYFDDTGEYEKLVTLDGPKREIVRTNDEILSFDFEHKVVRREKRRPRKMFPALLPEQLSSLTDYYKVRKVEQERIAGFDSQALMLEPRDKLRYGHKLWAEASSGLLLKARMLDEDSHLVEQFVFTQLAIGEGVTRESVAASIKPGIPGWRWDPPESEITAQGDTGWVVGNQPAGFRKIMEMKRSKAGSQARVAHLVFSDGLAAVSVFIEPLTTARSYQEGPAHQGAVNIYTRRLSDQLVTVLGEAPAATVMQMANSVGPKSQ